MIEDSSLPGVSCHFARCVSVWLIFVLSISVVCVAGRGLRFSFSPTSPPVQTSDSPRAFSLPCGDKSYGQPGNSLELVFLLNLDLPVLEEPCPLFPTPRPAMSCLCTCPLEFCHHHPCTHLTSCHCTISSYSINCLN